MVNVNSLNVIFVVEQFPPLCIFDLMLTSTDENLTLYQYNIRHQENYDGCNMRNWKFLPIFFLQKR